jgi:hypothetical protein
VQFCDRHFAKAPEDFQPHVPQNKALGRFGAAGRQSKDMSYVSA